MFDEQRDAQLKEMGAYSLWGMMNGFVGGKPPVKEGEGEGKKEEGVKVAIEEK